MKVEDILFFCDCVLVATLICIVMQLIDGYNPFWMLSNIL
mgnify:CR=1 FL=1